MRFAALGGSVLWLLTCVSAIRGPAARTTTAAPTTTAGTACASSPCQNGGVCVEEWTYGYNPPRPYWCYCFVPWSGSDCEILDMTTTAAPSIIPGEIMQHTPADEEN